MRLGDPYSSGIDAKAMSRKSWIGRPAHHGDFALHELIASKIRTGTTISVCLPARDERATVGAIIRSIHEDLVTPGLVDELIVMDDDSTDGTSTEAAVAGARVVRVSEVPPYEVTRGGKGTVLWKSLFASSGDVVCWIDADIAGFQSHMVTGLLGPLLTDPTIHFVKGFYDRPERAGSGGGRVTELVARPLIGMFHPHLADIVQPLAGATSARRHVLESVRFVRGWGVDLALLLDVADEAGVGAIAQCDLGTLVHDSKSLLGLGPQAAAALAIALSRAGIQRPPFDLRQFVDGEPVATPICIAELPPPIASPYYRSLEVEQTPA